MSSPSAVRRRKSEPAWDIARLFPNQGCWSEEEYLDLTDETNRLVEFTDGYIEILPMPTTRHQLIALLLYQLLDAFARERRLGAVLGAPLRIKLRDGKYREPDVLFMAMEHIDRARDRFWEGADLVMEVVSDGGRKRDLESKRFDYADAGIPEYWIVDPKEASISVLTLRDGVYVEHLVVGRGEKAGSVLLPGFEVDVTSVLDRSLV